jgi:hypothetical protein
LKQCCQAFALSLLFLGFDSHYPLQPF